MGLTCTAVDRDSSQEQQSYYLEKRLDSKTPNDRTARKAKPCNFFRNLSHSSCRASSLTRRDLACRVVQAGRAGVVRRALSGDRSFGVDYFSNLYFARFVTHENTLGMS